MTTTERTPSHLADAPTPTAPPDRIGPFAAVQALNLQNLVTFAAASLGAAGVAVSCGISVDPGSGLTETVASTDDRPVRVDWLHHELQEGPRVGATRETEVVLSRDLAHDPRWPEFGPMCAAVIGIHSLLSVTIPVPDESHAALNYYSDSPDAFDEESVTTATVLAREIGIRALALTLQLQDKDRDSPYLDNRLARALGILMGRYRMSSAAAFVMLSRASRDLDCTLIELATEVVLTGRLPARRISESRIMHASA